MEPDHRQIADFYNRHYHRDAVQAPPGGYHVRMAERLDVRPGENAMDIACGTGEWLAAVADRGAQVSGLDISERAVTVCQACLTQGALLGLMLPLWPLEWQYQVHFSCRLLPHSE